MEHWQSRASTPSRAEEAATAAAVAEEERPPRHRHRAPVEEDAVTTVLQHLRHRVSQTDRRSLHSPHNRAVPAIADMGMVDVHRPRTHAPDIATAEEADNPAIVLRDPRDPRAPATTTDITPHPRTTADRYVPICHLHVPSIVRHRRLQLGIPRLAGIPSTRYWASLSARHSTTRSTPC